MGALSPILRNADDGKLLFWCPGCDGAHGVSVGEGPGPRWGYNGNPEAPTFTPSILVKYPHWVPPAPTTETQREVIDICHSFVVDGKIQFLGDCTHALAGQTVLIPAWDAE